MRAAILLVAALSLSACYGPNLTYDQQRKLQRVCVDAGGIAVPILSGWTGKTVGIECQLHPSAGARDV